MTSAHRAGIARRLGLLALVCASLLSYTGIAAPKGQRDGTRRPVTLAEYERWMTELTNWGRWGKDDELGAVNLITPAKRKQAAALAKGEVAVDRVRGVRASIL